MNLDIIGGVLNYAVFMKEWKNWSKVTVLHPIQDSFIDAVSSGMVEKISVPGEKHRLQQANQQIFPHQDLSYSKWNLILGS